MVLFKIGTVDYTSFILGGTYDVNKEDITYDWEDGDHTIRKSPIRTQVLGSFTMRFLNSSDFEAFRTSLNAAKSQATRTVAASLYSNSTGELVSSNYFITMRAIPTPQQNGQIDWGEVEMEVEEA